MGEQLQHAISRFQKFGSRTAHIANEQASYRYATMLVTSQQLGMLRIAVVNRCLKPSWSRTSRLSVSKP